MSEMSVSTSMTPVRGETLTLNGLPFHYREWASPGASPGAPSLVLLHGGLGNARHWDTLAQSLADRYRVLALDQRGHGESARSPRGQYTPDLITGGFAGFVGELRLSRFPIVGFSFGGHVAYTFAAANPNQVSRLVMVETFVPPATPANIAYLNAGRGLPEVFERSCRRGQSLRPICSASSRCRTTALGRERTTAAGERPLDLTS